MGKSMSSIGKASVMRDKNQTKFITYILGCFSFLLMGCASGHCRGVNDAQSRSVYVYKADGSLQCEQGKAITPVDMAKELEGITVRSQSNKNDGRMHIMMCGGPTGKINIYEIAEKDLEAALKKGFRNLSELELDGSGGK